MPFPPTEAGRQAQKKCKMFRQTVCKSRFLFMEGKAPFSYRFFSILMNQFREDRAKQRQKANKKKKIVSNNLNAAQFAYYQRNVKHLLMAKNERRQKNILNDFISVFVPQLCNLIDSASLLLFSSLPPLQNA